MASSKQDNLSVKLTYTIRGEEQQSKIFSAELPAVLGLPANAVAVKPQAGDYGYSGMHDTGPLVPPIETTASTAEGRPMAYLIASVQQAKEYNDSYLTQWIENEKMTASNPQTKRAKTKDGDDHA